MPTINCNRHGFNHYNSQGYLVVSYSLESMDNGANFDTTIKRTFSYNSSFTRVAITDTDLQEGG